MTTRLNAVLIEEKEDEKFFTNLGSAFQHEDKKGFDIKLKAIPQNGEFSLFLQKDDKNELGLEDVKYMTLYAVESTKNDEEEWENFYYKIGVGFPHERGINVKMNLYPVGDLKITLRIPKED